MFVRLMMSCVSSTMGLSDEEHHRTGHAAFVDANALLKDEYRNPSQVQYYALFRGINEALTSIEYQRPSSGLTIVGEEAAVNIVRHVWRTALKTYETTLNERVSKASIKSREEFRQWSEVSWTT